MKTLEACYELEFSKINFVERKQKITHPKTLLVGPPKTGKSYLIYDYLSSYKHEEYLYIDFSDFRTLKEDIVPFLEEFIEDNNIQVLVLENYHFDFKVPPCKSIIITSTTPKNLFGFQTLYLHGLDFEEYLLHDNKHQNITNSFNTFLKYGNLSESIILDESHKVLRSQEVIELYAKDTSELEVLKLLCSSIDEKKSIFQLFTLLKKKIKISKDRFYELCKYYEYNHFIFFVEKYNQPKATKKIYTYNHAFFNAVSHTKKFKNEFTNMIFLELLKEDCSIYYLEKADFYIEESNQLILSIPFFNPFQINAIKKRLISLIEELRIEEIFIITIANSNSFSIKNIVVNITPFYEWSVQ